MAWIVLGEKNGKINLVSKSNIDGLLPKGAYLTIKQGKSKFILRVDDTKQVEPYSPSPMVIDMDLRPLLQDQKCQNIISAYRIKDLTTREDGLIDYIQPQSIAIRSSQQEIDLATSGDKEGPKVFFATVHASRNQLLIDESGKFITTNLPNDMFFHQTLICGKTGSGKTVAIKYLAQYFVEHLDGAVLAVNVKESDLLKMNEPSKVEIKKELIALEQKNHGLDNFVVYYPANSNIVVTKKINSSYAKKITLDVQTIDPDSLAGLLQNITDIAAQNLPNIFRSWQEQQKKAKKQDDFKFSEFVNYFSRGEDDKFEFETLNARGDRSYIKLHRGTFENIRRSLNLAMDFFDNENAECLGSDDILQKCKMSVIDVAVKNGKHFGAIILRDLLHKIVTAKNQGESDVPILIIIDEVHSFYNTYALENALGDIDTICRTGRSQKIGVIFASQNPADIPPGLSSVINSKIFFKADVALAKSHGITITPQEMESLKAGFAAVSIHDLPQARIIKFPMSFAGVFE